MRLKKLISAALALAVMCGIGVSVPITTSAGTIENEIVACRYPPVVASPKILIRHAPPDVGELHDAGNGSIDL